MNFRAVRMAAVAAGRGAGFGAWNASRLLASKAKSANDLYQPGIPLRKWYGDHLIDRLPLPAQPWQRNAPVLHAFAPAVLQAQKRKYISSLAQLNNK